MKLWVRIYMNRVLSSFHEALRLWYATLQTGYTLIIRASLHIVFNHINNLFIVEYYLLFTKY
jgi:hypothetical protein